MSGHLKRFASMSWEKICKKYGGVSVYVPKVIPSVREQILEEYNGYNKIFFSSQIQSECEEYRENCEGVEKISIFSIKFQIFKNSDIS